MSAEIPSRISLKNALFWGFALGIGGVILRHKDDFSVSTPSQIAGLTGEALGPVLLFAAVWFIFVRRKAKSTPPSAMDAFVAIANKSRPKGEDADLQQSVFITNELLLYRAIEVGQIERRAKDLNDGPMSYTTIDLAVATALGFYKDKSLFAALEPYQMMARMNVLNWLKEKKINPLLASAFEDTLYQNYKPRAHG